MADTETKKKVTKKKRQYKKKARVATKTIQCLHCKQVSQVPETELKLVKRIIDENVLPDGRVALAYSFFIVRCPKCGSYTQCREVEYRD